jgi:hypothetical protein
MTHQLEAILFSTTEQAADFASDCKAIFSTPTGQRVMAALCAACPPMANPFTLPGEPQIIAGRAEVVSLLLRGSGLPITGAQTQEPRTIQHGEHNQSREGAPRARSPKPTDLSQ